MKALTAVGNIVSNVGTVVERASISMVNLFTPLDRAINSTDNLFKEIELSTEISAQTYLDSTAQELKWTPTRKKEYATK